MRTKPVVPPLLSGDPSFRTRSWGSNANRGWPQSSRNETTVAAFVAAAVADRNYRQPQTQMRLTFESSSPTSVGCTEMGRKAISKALDMPQGDVSDVALCIKCLVISLPV